MIAITNKAKQLINKPIPEYLIKQRPGGGGKKLNYISGSTVIDMLNEAFDYLWNWDIEREWVQESQPKFNPKYDKEPVPQGPVAHVKGVLTVCIPQDDGQFLTVSKTGYGSKSIMGSQSDQESIFKAAGTDALKKAASMLGIGLSLYRDEDEQYYFDELNNVDLWTEKNINEKQHLIDYIAEFRDVNKIDDDTMVKIIKQFSNNTLSNPEDIIPTNIDAFVDFLKQSQEGLSA